MVVFIILLIIIVIAILSIIGVYNSLKKAELNVEQAFSNVSVMLQKRLDLIPNIVESIKGYTKHEQTTLENVIQARNKLGNFQVNSLDDIEKFQDLSNNLNNALKGLNVVVESYPEIKANPLFMNLQNSLSQIENEMEAANRYYNGVATDYNIKIATFPNNLIASLFKFKKVSLFKDDDAKNRYTGVKF